MGDVVNLNKLRKQKSRVSDQKKAAQNRIKFGRTKTQKEKEKQQTERQEQLLSGKKIVVKDSQQRKSTIDPPAEN